MHREATFPKSGRIGRLEVERRYLGGSRQSPCSQHHLFGLAQTHPWFRAADQRCSVALEVVSALSQRPRRPPDTRTGKRWYRSCFKTLTASKFAPHALHYWTWAPCLEAVKLGIKIEHRAATPRRRLVESITLQCGKEPPRPRLQDLDRRRTTQAGFRSFHYYRQTRGAFPIARPWNTTTPSTNIRCQVHDLQSTSPIAQSRLEQKIDQALEETMQVRAESDAPIMVTPLSQFVGSQAAINVIVGERYKEVTDQIIQYALGYWGRGRSRVIGPRRQGEDSRSSPRQGMGRASTAGADGAGTAQENEMRKAYRTISRCAGISMSMRSRRCAPPEHRRNT